MFELVGAFLLVGGLAFGGGQAALPLVERLAVGTFGWVTPAQFGVAVGLSYATPGPVLIIAAYIGYRAEGQLGALAAIGLLALTLVSLARPVTDVHPALLAGSALVAVAARRAHPLLLLTAATLLGATASTLTG